MAKLPLSMRMALIGISAVSQPVNQGGSLRKLFAWDITTRVTVDTSTGDTGISRYGEFG